MQEKISVLREQSAKAYAEKYKHVIKDYYFKPGDVVLVRNTVDEDSLSGRNRDRWWGPVIVVRRTKGGAYIVCEFNGAVWQKKIGPFRVIPYQQRERLKLGPHIEELIDTSQEMLDKLEAEPEEEEYSGKDLQFGKVRLRPRLDGSGDDGGEDSDPESEGVVKKGEFTREVTRDEPALMNIQERIQANKIMGRAGQPRGPGIGLLKRCGWSEKGEAVRECNSRIAREGTQIRVGCPKKGIVVGGRIGMGYVTSTADAGTPDWGQSEAVKKGDEGTMPRRLNNGSASSEIT
ncbi:hypothetical protein B0H17DRAFT_1126198 [Mycena rosella]|uniref:Uncharacterized protein n=1 Tax=Mycena rosella TaxID=1033263 RepID=A0AAD7M868_MYCRO|nr:hypothetical protein B0H17DRAFT_1126198 [Mycena rosella]